MYGVNVVVAPRGERKWGLVYVDMRKSSARLSSSTAAPVTAGRFSEVKDYREERRKGSAKPELAELRGASWWGA